MDIKYFILIVLIFLVSTTIKGQTTFIKQGSYSIVVDDEKYLLPPFLKAEMDKDGNLFYCDVQNILKFNSVGIYEKEISPIGLGPGEFEVAIDCDVSDNYLLVLPFNQFKVLFFNLEDLSFSHEIRIGNLRTRNLTVLNDSTFYVLSDVERGLNSFALTQFEISKKKFVVNKNLNMTPSMAYVGNTSNGGGFTTDKVESVYYTYVSYPNVWSYNSANSFTKVFEDVPIYFEESDIDDLNALKEPNNHLFYGGYMYRKSRTTGLFNLNSSFILQTIDTGNPWEGGVYNREKVIKYIEVWDSDGEKVFTNLKSPENLQLQFTLENLIYFKSMKAFSEEASKLKNGDRLKLFEIYSLQFKE